MKKIFTVLSTIVVAAFGLNAASLDLSKVEFRGFNPDFTKKVAQTQNLKSIYNETVDHSNVVKRTWTQGNITYAAYFMNLGPLTQNVELFGENNKLLTHEEVPFWAVTMQLYGFPKGGSEIDATTIVHTLLSWPSYRTWETTDLDEEISAGIVDVEEFINNNDGKSKTFRWNAFKEANGAFSVTNFFPALYPNSDKIMYFPIWSPLFDKQITNSCNGVNGLQLISNAPTQYSQFTLSSLDTEEENTLKMPFEFYFDNNASIAGNYNGPADFIDMVPENRVFNFEEMHVFNVGIITYKSLTDVYDTPFDIENGYDPVREFFFYGVEGCKLFIKNAESGFSTSNNFFLDGFNDKDQEEVAKVKTMRGGLFLKPEIDNFGGGHQWSMIQPVEYEEEYLGQILYGWSISPLPNSMVPSGYDKSYQWSEEDGINGYYKGYPYYPVNMNAATGTADGFYADGEDAATNTYHFNVQRVAYHFNPKNLNDVEWLDVVGDYVADFSGVKAVEADGVKCTVCAANGQVVVVAEGNAPVALYTLDGACVANAMAVAGEAVNIPAAKGVYVVKVGNNAVKVVL